MFCGAGVGECYRNTHYKEGVGIIISSTRIDNKKLYLSTDIAVEQGVW